MRPITKGLLLLGVAALAACQDTSDPTPPVSGEPGPAFAKAPTRSTPGVALMLKANDRLKARGLNIRVVKLEAFTIGRGRPADRLLTSDGQWVPSDPNRLADGTNLTYIIATNRGATSSGLTSEQTTDAIQSAFETWSEQSALRKTALVRRAFPGTDVSIFDELVDDAIGVSLFDDFGVFDGNPFAADIVNVGFLPRLFFEVIFGPDAADGVLAFSVSFIFVDPDGNPTDVNNDNRVDIALNEVYYNDTFGDPANPVRSGFPWDIGEPLPAIDVETVALHENGHSLQLGHFGSPPPRAVMNPAYGGVLTDPLPVDLAGLRTLWSSWPNR